MYTKVGNIVQVGAFAGFVNFAGLANQAITMLLSAILKTNRGKSQM